MAAQVCLGCKNQCKMDSATNLTGCTYEDGFYPKEARIWFYAEVLQDENRIKAAEKLIQKQYPTEWEQEEH